MNKSVNNNWAIGVLQIIVIGLVTWLLTSMQDVKERLVRIETQMQIRKAEK